MSSPRDARGSATPFAIACLGLLVLLAAALGVTAAMVRAHRQAQAAADLAALAAARAVGVRAAVPLGLCLLPAFVLIGIVPLVVALLADLKL